MDRITWERERNILGFAARALKKQVKTAEVVLEDNKYLMHGMELSGPPLVELKYFVVLNAMRFGDPIKPTSASGKNWRKLISLLRPKFERVNHGPVSYIMVYLVLPSGRKMLLPSRLLGKDLPPELKIKGRIIGKVYSVEPLKKRFVFKGQKLPPGKYLMKIERETNQLLKNALKRVR